MVVIENDNPFYSCHRNPFFTSKIPFVVYINMEYCYAPLPLAVGFIGLSFQTGYKNSQ